MVKRFLKYYKPHKTLFILDMVSALLKSAVMIVIPLIVHKILSDFLPAGNKEEMIRHSFYLSLLILTNGLLQYINAKWGHILGARMETDMRADLFKHLQKLSFRYFDHNKTGHIMSRMSNDLFLITEIAHHTPEDFFISFLLTTGSLAVMFSFHTTLALAAVIPLTLLFVWGMLYHKRMRQAFRKIRSKIADINSHVENAVQGIREVKSFGQEKETVKGFSKVNHIFKVAKEKMYTIMAGFHTGMDLFIESYSLIVILTGIYLIYKGQINVAVLVTFMIYIRFLSDPLKKIVRFAEQFQQGAAAFERFIEITDLPPDDIDEKEKPPLSHVTGEVSFKHVSFAYTRPDGIEGPCVLDNITLSVKPGQTVAIVGASGAGKSTLISLLPRFYLPQAGMIAIDGRDIREVSRTSLRKHIGIVRQDVFLFDSTIRENILLANPQANETQLIEAAKNANIYDFIMSLEDGFETLTGEHGVKLSGGQKQRISIARVFLKNPPILIFDEATSSLDSRSEELIQSSIKKLSKGRTTIIIAHRLSTVKNADHTIVLEEGQIIEEGRHKELLKRNGVYYRLYETSRLF